MGKKRILKALISTALACVLTASSLVGVFAAQGTRTVERSTVKWAKTVSYNYPKGTQTVQFTQDLGFTMHYFKLNSESGNLVAPNHLAFCIPTTSKPATDTKPAFTSISTQKSWTGIGWRR